MPRTIGQFASAYPRVQVHLLIDNWENLRQRLLEESIELFVADIRELQGDKSPAHPALTTLTGGDLRRPAHPLLSQAPRSLADLGNYCWPAPNCQRKWPNNASNASAAANNYRALSATTLAVLKALVAESDGDQHGALGCGRPRPVRSGHLALLDVPATLAALGLRPGQPGRPEPVTGRQSMAKAPAGWSWTSNVRRPVIKRRLPSLQRRGLARGDALHGDHYVDAAHTVHAASRAW